MWVKPGEGLSIRDPRTKNLIPAAGVAIDDGDLDFVRMRAVGDVVACEPPAEEPPAAEAAPAPEPAAEPAKPAAEEPA